MIFFRSINTRPTRNKKAPLPPRLPAAPTSRHLAWLWPPICRPSRSSCKLRCIQTQTKKVSLVARVHRRRTQLIVDVKRTAQHHCWCAADHGSLSMAGSSTPATLPSAPAASFSFA